MYEKLIERLRLLPSAAAFFGYTVPKDNPVVEIYLQAADAIEELSMRLHGDEAAIAGMKREIERMVVAGKPRWIPATEPPKEG